MSGPPVGYGFPERTLPSLRTNPGRPASEAVRVSLPVDGWKDAKPSPPALRPSRVVTLALAALGNEGPSDRRHSAARSDRDSPRMALDAEGEVIVGTAEYGGGRGACVPSPSPLEGVELLPSQTT